MPYNHINYLIPKTKDKRIKLSEEERDKIRKLYGTISQRKLAKMFGVSRRLIQFIGNPKAHEDNLKRRQENGGSIIYYSKAKNRECMKKHRKYKQQLYINKELINKGDINER